MYTTISVLLDVWLIIYVNYMRIYKRRHTPRGWRNVEKRPTLTIFFSWIRLTPSPPHLPNIVCFPSSNVFFECFFVIQVYFFFDSCTSLFCLPDLQFTRSTSYPKMFCAQVFAWRNIHGKLLKVASFVNFTVTSNIIAGIAAYMVEVHNWIITLSVDSLLKVADIDGGSAQPPEHQNVPPLHILTRSPNRFRSSIFVLRKSMPLRIRPLVIQLHAATPLSSLSLCSTSCTILNLAMLF